LLWTTRISVCSGVSRSYPKKIQLSSVSSTPRGAKKRMASEFRVNWMHSVGKMVWMLCVMPSSNSSQAWSSSGPAKLES
jgi:hypothetical protein